jgi:hypothetical protein
MIRLTTLPGLPATGPYPEQFAPGARGTHREGYVVGVSVDDQEEWVGNFQRGGSNYDATFAHPNGRDVLVIAGGQGYVIDPIVRRLQSMVGGAIVNVHVVDDGQLLILDQAISFEAIDAKGSRWHTRRLSWDGFAHVVFSGGKITGRAWALGDSWLPFEVDLNTGEATGGGYSIPPASKSFQVVRTVVIFGVYLVALAFVLFGVILRLRYGQTTWGLTVALVPVVLAGFLIWTRRRIVFGLTHRALTWNFQPAIAPDNERSARSDSVVMEQLQIDGWVLNFDAERTRSAYANADRGTQRCSCSYCRNFFAVRDSHYSQALEVLLKKLGVAHHKEAEIYELGAASSNGSRLYGGWYHFVGEVVADPGISAKVGQPGETKWNLSFRSGNNLAFESFNGLCLVELTFTVELPWVLDEAPGS